MKIKIFLASSIVEFKEVRNEIGALVRRVQDILINDDIRVNLFICEYYDSSLSVRGRKQDDYMDELVKSDIFLMLVGKKLGDYTKEEFNKANECKNIQKEIIFIKNDAVDDSVISFKSEVHNNKNTKVYLDKSIEEVKQIILNSISLKLGNVNLVYENGIVKNKDSK